LSRAVDFIDKQVYRQEASPTSVRRKALRLKIFKRALDLLGSAFGLFFLSPFFLYVAIRIHKESPGPVFYRGVRMGKAGKPSTS
jgi:lipopolysaccharide/colanic/teichoic acid biosynthesis glycosyltransferase